MQRVIGLDIGSYSIKAVEIINTFKSYEIANFYENVIPNIEELDPDVVIPHCMEQLFRENNLKADRIITAMPGQYISSRVMAFNFSDVRKIETAVMAEVEDAVPFNLDDMIVDHQILGNMDGQTIALVVMTRKNFLQSFLEYLQRIDIDPKLIDVDSLAFYNLSSYLDMEPGQCCGLVDVGHEKTSVCIVQDGVLRMFRSINLGGRYISEFLARDLETQFAEAQRVKHRVSRVLIEEDLGKDLAEDDRVIAERITLASNAIVKELGRTFYAFKTWEKAPISKLFVSGGTTRIKNFDRYLESQLEIPVAVNRLDESELKINPDLSSHMSIMPQSVAIGMRAVTSMKRHSQINLRQGEFAYVQSYANILRATGTAVKVIGVAMFLLGISYGVMRTAYKQKIEALQGQYYTELTGTFPELKKQYKPGKYRFKSLRSSGNNKLNGQIDEKRQAVDTFVSSNQASPPLTLLRDISEAMPEDITLNVTQYEFKTTGATKKVTFKGETNDYESVENVKQALTKVNNLKDVKEKSSGGKVGEDKIIEFVIEARYSAGDDDVSGG